MPAPGVYKERRRADAHVIANQGPLKESTLPYCLAMTIAVTTLLIHAKDMQRSVRFYADHFGYATSYAVADGLMELTPHDGEAEILIHQAAKSLKLRSAALKLSFSVPDVDRFVATAAAAGLDFGIIRPARAYAFASTQDPDGNSISVSSRQHRAWHPGCLYKASGQGIFSGGTGLHL